MATRTTTPPTTPPAIAPTFVLEPLEGAWLAVGVDEDGTERDEDGTERVATRETAE
tara:strand:+ start:6350 stop:6517 length:168 start_codon:yes stop_codon:yes gene_type:complete